jgi:hypothetical protein
MTPQTLQFFGYLSAIISIIAILPYIYNILKGETKPERASWMIWAVLGSIAFFSQLEKGATNSLWMVGASTLSVAFVFLLSLKYGYGKFSKRDKVSLLIATMGLLLWYITKEAALALFFTIAVDLIGSLLTTIKSYEDPESETVSTWIISSISGLLAAISVGEWNIILLIYPLYIFLANLSVFIAIILGKRNKIHAAHHS